MRIGDYGSDHMWEICEDAEKELLRELFTLLNAMCEDFELICPVICRTCLDVDIYTDHYRRTQINCHQCGKKLHAHQSCFKHRDYVECSCYQVEYGFDMEWFIEKCGAFACRDCGKKGWNVHNYTDAQLNEI